VPLSASRCSLDLGTMILRRLNHAFNIRSDDARNPTSHQRKIPKTIEITKNSLKIPKEA